MDKLTLGFICDVLYWKGIINYDEYVAIMDVKVPADLDVVFEKMLKGEFNAYKKGEAYAEYSRY